MPDPDAGFPPIPLADPLASEVARVLGHVRADWQTATADPVLGRRGVGVPGADHRLLELSAGILATLPESTAGFDGPDVFLATQIYKDGGHTGLMGDMACALAGLPSNDARPARLIVTNAHGHHPKSAGPAYLTRLGPLANTMTVLDGSTDVEKLGQFLGMMRVLRPRRVFLFHHPDDPIPVIAAGPGWTGKSLLVHHADAIPSLGLHWPGATLVDLNPSAAALSRAAGFLPAILPMTVPDPGPRPVGFLHRGRLVTATCARTHKVRADGPVTYAAMIPILLAETGGWHVHIGTLDEDLLASIFHGLAAAGIAADRLVYLPLVSSLARALHDHQVDVYLSSFPIDGARTNVEVAAAGVPYLGHARPGRSGIRGGFPLDGRMDWTDWDDLRLRLQEIHAPGCLEEFSRRMRSTYLTRHHPGVFAAILADILVGGWGWNDPDAAARDVKARAHLAGA